MAMRQFKAESKKLLDLMINSIYTNREIWASARRTCTSISPPTGTAAP